jgi:hypothetical protein
MANLMFHFVSVIKIIFYLLLPTFYDMVFRGGGGLRVYYVIRGEGVSDFTQLTTIRLEEYKTPKKLLH